MRSRSATMLCFLGLLASIGTWRKRRTKNAKAFHDKCENSHEYGSRSG
ncbi:hypothetical protein ABLN64_12150 [Mycobacterium tuberculosis]